MGVPWRPQFLSYILVRSIVLHWRTGVNCLIGSLFARLIAITLATRVFCYLSDRRHRKYSTANRRHVEQGGDMWPNRSLILLTGPMQIVSPCGLDVIGRCVVRKLPSTNTIHYWWLAKQAVNAIRSQPDWTVVPINRRHCRWAQEFE